MEGLHERLMEYVDAVHGPAYPPLPWPGQPILTHEAPLRNCPMPMPFTPARVELNGMIPSVLA